MRIRICEGTTFPASFEDELDAYRAAGAGSIGILEFKFADAPDVRGKLRESGVAASACLPTAGSILPSPLPGEGSRAAVRALEAAGYQGWYDVEVISHKGTFGNAFSDSLSDLPVEEIARRSVESKEVL